MTQKATSAPSAPDTGAYNPRSRTVIGILLVATFIVFLNETIMSVALPRLMTDLDISASTAQWLTTGFLLTMAVVIPITGFILKRFHTRQIFVFAMTLFSVGTLAAAVAPGFAVLLAARILQAGGTAIMLPLLTTTAMTLVPPERLGRTMGSIAIVISVAPAVGPTLSGLILSVFSWRFMFILVLPVAVLALVVGIKLIENVTEPRKVPLDVLSVVMSAIAFGGLLYGLAAIGEGAAHGPQPIPPTVPIAVGAIALALFVYRQSRLTRRSTPLLDLRVFKIRTFTMSMVVAAITSIALFGSLILLPIHMQSVLGLDTLTTGLLLLPGGVATAVLSPVVGRIYDKVGPTALLLGGAAFISVSLGSMALALKVDSSPALVPITHILLGIGLAMTFTPLFSASLGSLQPDLYPHGSAILNTVQQLMGGVGTAMFVTLLSTSAARSIADGTSGVQATSTGIQTAFSVGALIAVFSIIACCFVRKPNSADVAAAPAALRH